MKTQTQKTAIFDRMAKKKTGGEHTTPRKPVQMPMPWYKLTSKLASNKKQPMLWYLMSLLAKEAEEANIERPKLPWEEP